MEARSFALVGAYAAVLLIVHVVASRGTGTLPPGLHHVIGASAETTISRWWAQWTAMVFHNSWGHIGYNLVVLFATLPWAIDAYGQKAILVALVLSPLAAYTVNLLLILPLASSWPWAAAAVAPRLVGASIAIFAGAGMAWTVWDAHPSAKALAVVAFVIYEVGLAVFAVTQPFVAGYHLMGAAFGIGAGLAMR